ncbi:MAG: hypothetical protein V4573_15155 [Pseudomonadota bacterium]
MPSDIKDLALPARTLRAAAATALLAACCLVACSTAGAPPVVQAAPAPVETPPVTPVIVLQPAASASDLLAPVLVYADRIRNLQGSELAQEITRLGEAATADEQLRLAMALAQTRQLYDLVRAQDLLQRVLNNSGSDARPLHPLARLLATRLSEQRRVEDQLDRQSQQLRDTQRRLDQTNDKLEALKEIERSLTPRAGSPAPPATARNRPGTLKP